MNKCFDKLENALTAIFDFIIFILARMVIVNTPWSRVRGKNEYAQVKSTRIIHSDMENVDIDMAEFLYAEAKSAVAYTDGNARQLLSISLGVLSVFLVFGSTLYTSTWNWLVLLGCSGLLITATLCLRTLNVRRSMLPTIEDEKDEWAKSIHLCAIYVQSKHLYLVDLYRTAWRWMVIGFLCFCIAFIYNITKLGAESSFDGDKPTTSESSAQEVQE